MIQTSLNRLSALFFTLSILGICGCEKQTPPQGAPSSKVTILRLAPQTPPLTLEFTGQTVGVRVVDVRARVEGILLKRLFTEGSQVKKGDTLFHIDPVFFEAQVSKASAGFAKAKAQLEDAQKNFNRVQKLLPTQAVSQKDFDNALSTLQMAEAAVLEATANQTQAALNLSYTKVAAPITGFTSLSGPKEGSLVSPNQNTVLVTLTQLRPMNVLFGMTDKEWLLLQKHLVGGGDSLLKSTQAYTKLTLADGTPYPHSGAINFVDPQMDPQSGTFRVRAQFKNPDLQLRSGQFVKLTLVCQDTQPILLLPTRAILQGPKGPFVYVKDPQGKAAVRQIKGYEHTNHLFQIEGGLNTGDEVVIDGGLKIREGVPLEVTHTLPSPQFEPPQ